MNIDLSRFRHAFFQEAAEHVDNMESGLLELSSGNADPEQLNAIFRAAHSIKGASGTFGLDDVMRFTHALEEVLDRMRQGKVEPSPERVNLLLEACDMLRTVLAAAEANTPPPGGMEQLLASITVAQRAGAFAPDVTPQVRKSDLPTSSGPTNYRVRFKPSSTIFQEGMDPLLVIRELRDVGEMKGVVADLSQLPRLSELRPDVCYLSWDMDLQTSQSEQEIRDVFAFVEDGAEVTIEPKTQEKSTPKAVIAPKATAEPKRSAANKRAHEANSIRVSTAKVDQLINVVGELLISQSMAAEIATHFQASRLGELQAALAEVSRNTREVQDRVMGIRMLPVGTAFGRMPRIVHDVSKSTGKPIRIEIVGEDAELDKTILEGIVDPLTHLVRNAADHGIESVEERRAAGKPEEGTVTLRARHEGGNFVIEVADDGQGLDLARIRQKAIERGLTTEDEELTDEQIRWFIFRPGFSTAAVVSDISGRGVGMDVVRKNVEMLGGTITLNSTKGLGTTVAIKLPLTLAILEGQLVRVGGQIYVLPLVSILESIRPSARQWRSIAGQGEVVALRQDSIPLLRLHEVFGIETDVVDPSKGLVAIVEHEGRRLALLVDELLGQQQVVIKNLQTNFRKVEGAMGATILGDGRVSLILDVAGLVALSVKKSASCVARML